jgi:hypothetical protein
LLLQHGSRAPACCTLGLPSVLLLLLLLRLLLLHGLLAAAGRHCQHSEALP